VLSIDINCDMGEGMDTDVAIFPYISSANIACGYHAGDEDTMRRTVDLALAHGVAIGAHPGFPDWTNFGRIDILDSAPGKGDRTIRYEDLAGILYEQLHRLQQICQERGTRLQHIKPHGALYNRAAADPDVSDLICRSVAAFDPSVPLYGLSGSQMEKRARISGLPFACEVFADRTYQANGSLTPRSESNAMINDPAKAIAQVLKIVREGRVITVKGSEITLQADTVCLHGDSPHAVEFARIIHSALSDNGVVVF
jgi:5-oxoprolinase (ATP-hydrolysing) subunit A